ncbi:sialidase family protein [Rhodocyclus gracilis]|uniref:Sialidase domain-containing protein n=1 Tax=Rhodocyclus tenuis TaxID=1066 RepID=A0A6L5JW83_RHOTE|nr:sialidase family protein [Rhodocyclus gracilis]MQY51499.1 hypothetical protein [Rhodocyclus gracilis]
MRRKRSTPHAGWRALTLLLLVVAFGAGALRVWHRPPAANFLPSASDIATSAAKTDSPTSDALVSRFVSPIAGPHRHAASLVELKDGRIRAFWFSGSQEGAPDVEIRSAVFDPRRGEWSPEARVTDRFDTARGLWRYVKKLGNPVAERAADGSLRLYYVTVSLGGWAGSSITTRRSDDDGATWSAPQRLITSPFLNLSTLVKGTPFHYADDSIGLPVYHEFINKFGEILRLDRDGRLLDKQRLSVGHLALQPVVLVRDTEHAQVLMRHSDGGQNRVIGSSSDDGGRHWTRPSETSLRNPNSAVAGVVLADGTLLAVLNDIEGNRDALSLLASTDGGANWRTLRVLEDQTDRHGQELDVAAYRRRVAELARADGADASAAEAIAEAASTHMCPDARCGFEFSYPYLILTARGDVELVYTWNRSYIKHTSFPRHWLAQRLHETTDAATTKTGEAAHD